MTDNLTRKRPFDDTSNSSENDGPPRKITRPKTVLSPVTKGQQSEMDQKVLAHWVVRLLPEQLDIDHAATLLERIVIESGDLMDQSLKGSVATELVRESLDLQKALQAAWIAKQFDTIRNLDMLQAKDRGAVPEAMTRSPQRVQIRMVDKDVQMNAISSAWRQPYVGIHHTLLHKNINNMNRNSPYTNTVAIVQSSGTGKSRMVHEQANLVFTLPFNLRADVDNQDLAYPHADTTVRDYFMQLPENGGCAILTDYYYLFLRHLFEKTLNELTTLRQGQAVAANHAEIATLWRNHLEKPGVRDNLYQSVTSQAEASKRDLYMVDKNSGTSRAGSKEEGSSTSSQEKDVANPKNQALTHLKKLISYLDRVVDSNARQKLNGKEPLKLVLYFDEAHILTDQVAPDPNPEHKDLHFVLCSCFEYLRCQPIFAIYLSTNSRIEKLAGSGDTGQSSRARANAGALQVPITEVPFDCAEDLLVSPRKYSLSDVSQLEFMSKFGRALFWTLLEGAGDNRKTILDGIIGLARSKLLCHHDIDLSVGDFSANARLAVCDVRLTLNYEPLREAMKVQGDLIASHMRIAYTVPTDRAYVRSGYSSEPVLAEAAAQQMYAFRKYNPSAVLNILCGNMGNGLLDLGERGEVVARFIVMSAYDRAVEREHKDNNPNAPKYSKGCSAIAFIEELFSEEYATKILDSVPDNMIKRTTLREAFKKSKIRFTHFAKWRGELSATTEAMFAAFVRGMAVICCRGHHTVDFLIPVLLYDSMLCEEVMTAILVQVKREATAGSLQKYAIDAEELDFFPKPSKGTSASSPSTAPDTRPYLTIIMELGVQAKLPLTATIHVKMKRGMSTRSSKAKARSSSKAGKATRASTTLSGVVAPKGELRHNTSTHPRYSVYAYGCSPAVYKVIGLGEKARYAFLLASRDVVGEHFRRDPDSLGSLRALKPLFTLGEGCFHWFESKFLSPQFEDDTANNGWVVTGDGAELEDGGDANGQDDDDVFMDES